MKKKNEFVIYRSSAGSGKTFTLVKEYLTLALPNASFKDILAVTFTNSAVNEMKARILEELSKMKSATSAEGNDMMTMLCGRLGYDVKTLSQKAQELETKILHNYSDFAVCTIDSFVQNTIRPFAHDLNIPLNYEIQLENRKIKEESVRQLFSEIGHDEKFTKIVLSYLESQMDNEKAWDIEKKLVEYSNEIFKENSPANLQKLGSRTTEDYLEFHKLLSSKNRECKEQVKKIADEVLAMIDNEGLGQDDFYKKSTGVYAYFKKISSGEIKEMTKAAKDFIEDDNCRYNSKTSERNKNIIESLSGRIIDYLKDISNVVTKYKSRELLLENLYAMALLNAIAKFVDNYSADKGILHISEFTKRLADVVFNESVPFIYERIGERYKHFLVDEFQDTSVLQWQILLPLFENTLSSNEDAFTLVVGDAKQAIYRFRQGEVEQFVKLPDIYIPAENESMRTLLEGRGRVLKAVGRIDNLTVNYRTAEKIVEFNNAFFEGLMQSDMAKENKRLTDIYIGERSANANERAALVQDFSPKKKGGYVSIKFVDVDDNNVNGKEENVCEEVYRTIVDQVENKGYNYNDIAILARKKKELLEISSYLSSKNIDVLSSESFLLMKNPEVLFLVSLLQVLNRPTDSVSALNVLDYLQKHSGDESQELYNSYFISDVKNNSLFTFLKNKGYKLNFDEAELLSMTLYDCCETLIREFSLKDIGKEFVTSFLNEVADYSTKNRQNLSEFLDYLDENADKLSLKGSSAKNAVTLMTIHKSKGLEFPVVICPVFGSKKESGDRIWVKLVEEEYLMPVGWVSYKDEMAKTDFDEYYYDEKSKKQLDEINILYVAFTRPKEKLFVVVQNRKSRTIKTDNIQYYLEQFVGDNKKYAFGDDTEKTIQSKENNDEQCIHISSLLSEKSTISVSPERTSAIEEGILIHDIFSCIYTASDIDKVIEMFKLKMGLHNDYAETLRKRVEKVVYDDNYAKYFDPKYLVKTESDILYKGKISGKAGIERPDRIIFADNETWIVDFKTGMPAIVYQDQINRYIKIIADMGYPNVSGEVIYC